MTLNINNVTPNIRSRVAFSSNNEKGSKSDKAQQNLNVVEEKQPKSQQKEYNDPLMQWPYRGLAFTNDVGAAVMDIAPNLGMGLWVPALMYFGADIYDKYKSDQEEYKPSGKRACKQAIFQACASVMMPIIVVHNGQKAASLLGQKRKNGMSLQLQEEVDKFTVDLLKRRNLKDYENDKEGFKKEFNEHLKNHLQDRENSMKTKNPFKLLKRWIFGAEHTEKLSAKKFANIAKYANENIDDMFEIRQDLLADRRPKKLSNKLVRLFDDTKKSFSKDKHTIAGYVEDSIKETLKQRQRDRLFQTKLWKTAGGFVALGVSIKFIDHFVEKYIIEKLVEPGLENIDTTNGKISFGKHHKSETNA